jgi:predicted DNA-binding transcriptional regulator YafY
MTSTDSNQAERVYRIANMLREGEMTVAALVLALYPDASTTRGDPTWRNHERNILRDLELIEGLEKHHYQRRGQRNAKHSIRTDRSSMHPIQRLALFCAARLAYHSAPGERRYYLAALNTLRQWLPETIQPILLKSVADIGKRSNSRESINLEPIANAWFDLKPVRFEYQSAQGSGQWRMNELEIYLLEVDPVSLALYVVGRETSYHQKVRLFKLSRMRGVKAVDGAPAYAIPEAFDPKEFFAGAWGVVGKSDGETIEVKLRFSPEVKRRIEEGGFPNMTKSLRADGFTDVTIVTGIEGKSGLSLEVLSFVRSYGQDVEVLEPADHRQRWLADARELVARYGGC